jgi:hypothetical protein
MSLDTTWFPNQEMDNAWKIGGNTGPLNKSPEKFIHILDKNKSSVCVCSWQGDGRRYRRR